MRAKGWFFNQTKIFPYAPTGVVWGQGTQDSCVAACCRMLLEDHGQSQPEAFLRTALRVDQGAYLSELPTVFRHFGLPITMVYRNKLTFEELRAAIHYGPAVVFVRAKNAEGHALIVDSVDDLIGIRDPLPQGKGKAYRITKDDFKAAWLRPHSRLGQAVIVEE